MGVCNLFRKRSLLVLLKRIIKKEVVLFLRADNYPMSFPTLDEARGTIWKSSDIYKSKRLVASMMTMIIQSTKNMHPVSLLTTVFNLRQGNT